MAGKVEGGRRSDVQLNFRLPASIKEEVDTRAEQLGCSTAAFIRLCIVEKLGYIKGVERSGILTTGDKKKIRFDGYMKFLSAQIDSQENHYTKHRNGVDIDHIESYPVFTREEVENIIGEVMEEKINKLLAEKGLTPADDGKNTSTNGQ